jgi:hypothetical protein
LDGLARRRDPDGTRALRDGRDERLELRGGIWLEYYGCRGEAGDQLRPVVL